MDIVDIRKGDAFVERAFSDTERSNAAVALFTFSLLGLRVFFRKAKSSLQGKNSSVITAHFNAECGTVVQPLGKDFERIVVSR